mmetsp:Transcript_33952/g.85850  ORF Transcript_33952/g.85850 Transcript_33952/m.85850 type:complete len:153 (+) Transcript_33952:149-607(+)|eukprot:CAMPEP_0173422126 /NCGR_PEP_ID=MMETSP1357-20121228/2949_1 /TAXON_ID=77926 /ORGANISM="Hemiselmis rufescens, Strain PCC563" /LENGTH=152 /DNA_ID=CAMNT_0014385107 /DNA_START=147 /DNA_END=605 /DNA_ORIENTATION=+
MVSQKAKAREDATLRAAQKAEAVQERIEKQALARKARLEKRQFIKASVCIDASMSEVLSSVSMGASLPTPYVPYTEEEEQAGDDTPAHTAAEETPTHTAADKKKPQTAIDETPPETAIGIWNGTDFDFPDDWLAGCSLEGCSCTYCQIPKDP